MLNPVEIHVPQIFWELDGLVVWVGSPEAIHLLSLGLGHVCHEVDANGGSSILRVVLLDGDEGVLKYGRPELELLLGAISLSVLSNVLNEFVVVRRHEGGLGGSQESCDGERFHNVIFSLIFSLIYNMFVIKILNIIKY